VTPERFAILRRLLSDRLAAALRRLFLDLGAWREEDARRFAAQAVPLVQGAQRTLATLTAAYVAAQATEAIGRPVPPPGIPDTRVLGLRGVDPAQVYRRPFVELYTALARGKPMTEALDLASSRLSRIAELDMQQTYAHATQAAMQALPPAVRPSGWRRVLIGPENCALCVVASTQSYTIETLNPMHPACDCTVAPLFGDVDHVIEPDQLERVHAAVQELTGTVDRGARAPDYRQITVAMTNEHGELGPMLARPRDRFTTAADLPT